MKRTKLLVTGLIIGILFTGCAKEVKKSGENPNGKPSTKLASRGTSKGSKVEYDVAGFIVEIKGSTVGIMSGDVIENFTFTNEALENFYVGQDVYIKDNKLHAFVKDNYDQKYTYMGELIYSARGKLMSFTEDKIVISIDGKATEYKTYMSAEDINDLEKDMDITADYIDRDGEKIILEIFNEDNVIDMKVVSIQKGSQGQMILNTEDSKRGKYVVTVGVHTNLNFNHSQLRVGDEIKVYPTRIAESYPAQVDTNKILMIDTSSLNNGGSDKPKKHVESKSGSDYDYEAGGEILEINGDTVTILSGDIAEDYKFDKEILKGFYVGESVVIKNGELFSYVPKDIDYDIDHTSMGEMILFKQGTVRSISNDSIDIEIDGKLINFGSYLSDKRLSHLKEDMNITVGYLSRNNEKFILNYFDEDMAKLVTVSSISRDNASGKMIITAKDSSDETYKITVSFGLRMNFKHSELQPGDTIKVYPVADKDSSTDELPVNKIWKQ